MGGALFFLLAIAALIVYFVIATIFGVSTGWDPFDKSTPLRYRLFLWPCAVIWNKIFPGPNGR